MDKDEMKPDVLDEAELDALFGSARAETAAPGDDLVARILADARENLPPLAAAAPEPPAAGPGWFGSLIAMLGGAPAAAGLAMAGIAGLGFGYLDNTVADSTANAFGLELGAYDVGDLYVSIPGAE